MFRTSWFILGSVLVRAIIMLLSTLRQFRCLVLINTKAEKPLLKKITIANEPSNTTHRFYNKFKRIPDINSSTHPVYQINCKYDIALQT
nr:unnamed protein product [Callosobruchus analis]